MKEVHEEMGRVMNKVIPPGKGKWGAKPITLDYCFERYGVPRTATEYLMVVYSASFPPLERDTEGETFEGM